MQGGTHEQRMHALARADNVRVARARLKDEIRAGTVLPSQVLADPPAFTRTMPVATLLAAPRNQGKTRAMRHLVACRIGEGRTMEALSDRQRAALIERLEAFGL